MTIAELLGNLINVASKCDPDTEVYGECGGAIYSIDGINLEKNPSPNGQVTSVELNLL